MPPEGKIESDIEMKPKSDSEVKIQQDNIVQAVQEVDKPEEKDAKAASLVKAEEDKEAQDLLFTDFKPVPKTAAKKYANILLFNRKYLISAYKTIPIY